VDTAEDLLRVRAWFDAVALGKAPV
jgi:hypothetical protein